ncbi:Rv3235 family protein [Rhodococcus sp. H29-C3]|uniref:Rv3235 family protein n=1 Tax=Rhodococcus sp. H29-C3 TaxID=3046307 RepID=UPI0024BB0EB6|nr:Rv3235 family protein [Rhodococcus sp. H29-C3]MDJ0361619.1 Rv3235 family protein [Rhodococcus sp. H29-C3]
MNPAERQASEDAQRGAEHALRLILEILDRRRTPARLGALFTPTVVESLKTLVNSPPPGRSLGAASLRRVHVSRCAKHSAEVFGTYARGPRIFAVAARLEYRKTARHSGWTVTSVRIR